MASVTALGTRKSRLSQRLQKLVTPNDGAARLRAPDELLITDQGSAAGDRILVSITTDNMPGMSQRLTQDFGFEEVGRSEAHHLLEGWLPIDNLGALETLEEPSMGGIRPVYQPITNVGSAQSQADWVLESDRVRAALPTSYDGTGIRIGVMSDSYNNLGGANGDIQSGDLPGALNPLGNTSTINVLQELPSGGIDEGRAMLQLVHDLAPKADLAFSSVFFGQANFAQQIRDLANPAIGNADVLVDDISYLNAPFFQDGPITQAVDEVVTTRGVTYFSSAGNSANNSYESSNISFVDSTALDAIFSPAYTYYDFNPGAGTDLRQSLNLGNGEQIRLSLQWDDPFFTTNGVDTDLDIVLIDPVTNAIVAASADDNPSTNEPVEILSFVNTTGSAKNYDLVIGKFSGPNPGLLKYINFGNGGIPNEFDTNSPTIFGHPTAVNGMAVAAAPYFDQLEPEPFTSVGPSQILFNPNGTRKATPEIRQTPDITATDGTDTTFFGQDIDGNDDPNFFGTSAAAPHAAAVAALVKQANPTFTPQQIYDRLTSTATDIGATGFDNVTGAGLINAYDAIFGPVQPAAIDFSDDFNDGDLSNAYETRSTGAGRIQVTTNNGPLGSQHVTMDSARNGDNSLNELILHVDASGESSVELSFAQREFGDEDNPMPASFSGSGNYDGVALSVDGNQWYRVVSLTGSNSSNSYQTQTFNLSDIAANNGITLGSDVRIKFQQFDNFGIAGTSGDGFAFDNIQVTSGNGGGGNKNPVTGTDGFDFLVGTPVADAMSGLGGTDYLYGGDGDDHIDGGDGSDILVGQGGDDELLGGNGVDYLYGDAGIDVLDGGAGADILYGDFGSANEERFVLRSGDGSDTIYYYDDGQDKFQLDGITVGQIAVVSAFFGLNTELRLGSNQGELLATLAGVSSNAIDVGDFIV